MTWTQKQIALSRIGLINFTTEREFENWLQWENDDLQLEKRIKNALHEVNSKTRSQQYKDQPNIRANRLHQEQCG